MDVDAVSDGEWAAVGFCIILFLSALAFAAIVRDRIRRERQRDEGLRRLNDGRVGAINLGRGSMRKKKR